MTNGELAKALGVHLRTVQGYVSRGMPEGSIDEARDWIAENIGRNGPPTIGERAAGLTSRRVPKNELDEEEQRARIEKLNEEARQKKLKNDLLEGRLYQADDVELQVAELTAMIRGELENWPDHLQNEWPAEYRAQATELLRTKTELLLRRMSQWRLGA